ncbi:MAG: glycerol kinase GlpK [Candidatus Nanopelagicales bacterium]|jgi:glycerol kinase
MALLAIDAGTTGVTALAISEKGEVVAKGYSEFTQHFPQPGWVEHDPDEIWQATLAAVGAVIAAIGAGVISAIGITNQRETVMIWDRETFSGPRRGIVWQDRRTSDLVVELRNSGIEKLVREKTGLGLDPYFSSSKFLWLSRNEKEVWQGVVAGKYAVGTVDTFLIARMTKGRVHATDASNASRTQLLNLKTGNWDDELLEIFSVPKSVLPDVVPSYGAIATTDPTEFLGLSLPIAGIAGDQQAALFGQVAFDIGDSKCTYGTGSFILYNTGAELKISERGLLTTIAWQEPSGEITYALEGAVFVTGAAVQWLRDGLGIIKSAAEIESLANSVETTDGVVFVPALSGLGAPYWDPYARGSIHGITRGTTAAHIARATLEAIAFQVRDVVEAMVKDTKQPLAQLRVDGGAAVNNLLMQMQADILKVPVVRGKSLETTGIGAAYLAGLGSGVWASKDELRSSIEIDREFTPAARDEWEYVRWQRAVQRSQNWVERGSN